MSVVSIEGNGTRESHRGDGFKESDIMYTLNTTEQHKVAFAVENNQSDARIKIIPNGKSQCLLSRAGTGGNNVPLVLEPKRAIGVDMYNQSLSEEKSPTLGVNCGMSTGRNGVITLSIDRRQQSVDEELMNTLTTMGGGDNYPTVFIRTTQQGYPCVAYNIGSYTSNAMLSDNPHSGIYETEICKTLDASGPNPAKNQGGTVILQPAAVDDHSSKAVQPIAYIDGWGGNMEKVFLDDKMNTLRAAQPQVLFQSMGVDAYNKAVTGDKAKTLSASASDSDHIPCVCIETFHCVSFEEETPTLKARDYKDPPCVLVGEIK